MSLENASLARFPFTAAEMSPQARLRCPTCRRLFLQHSLSAFIASSVLGMTARRATVPEGRVGNLSDARPTVADLRQSDATTSGPKSQP